MLINAENLIAGRVAAFAAKQALLGETVTIVNAEKAVITGNKKFLLTKYLHRIHRGMPVQGPFFHRRPERFMKRMIRGMLPYRQYKGATAFKRVCCYIGTPAQFSKETPTAVPRAHIDNVTTVKYISVNDLCNALAHTQDKQAQETKNGNTKNR